MEATKKQTVTLNATVNAPIEKVWSRWTEAEHITKWNSPSTEWHTPWATTDFKEGGSFVYRMEARDGSMGFDFGGVFDRIEKNKNIATTLGDGRKVTVEFTSHGDTTSIVETFEVENENPVDFQRAGWQAIVDSFKKYAEGE